MRALVPVLLLAAIRPAVADPLAPIADADDQQIPIAQVERVVDLSPRRGRIEVRFVLQHTGGSTDVSPHWRAYLAIYRSAEMCDDLVAYDLGASYAPVAPKKTSRGRFTFSPVVDTNSSTFERQVRVVDPAAAVAALAATGCEGRAPFTTPIDVRVRSRRSITSF